MRALTAEELRKDWGDKPCSHPKIEREYSQGWPTGRSVCTRCGAVQQPAGVSEKQLHPVG